MYHFSASTFIDIENFSGNVAIIREIELLFFRSNTLSVIFRRYNLNLSSDETF